MYAIEVDTRELRAGLRELDRALPRVVGKGHKRVAMVVARAGAREAPKVSGALARSTRAGGTQTKAMVRAGNAAVPYAPPIHWGWPARNIAPNEFLERAVKSTTRTVTQIYDATMDQALRSAGL